ncbi:C-type lectin 37Db-like [Saccostrea echinata]|uniref:C-type lectin 37Db-like n=1 Tax=Saccostrea echinata TaxID=191078 RepID=UPI002A7F9574|nr:C-type lectin 37Db-like [Saccostrea echinata]
MKENYLDQLGNKMQVEDSLGSMTFDLPELKIEPIMDFDANQGVACGTGKCPLLTEMNSDSLNYWMQRFVLEKERNIHLAPCTTLCLSFCKGLSAKLVEIETRDENDFLQHHLQNMMHGHNYWIGLTDAIVENEWLWMSTQQEAHFTNWGLLQPDNAQNNEDCADMAFFYPQGVWNDENY